MQGSPLRRKIFGDSDSDQDPEPAPKESEPTRPQHKPLLAATIQLRQPVGDKEQFPLKSTIVSEKIDRKDKQLNLVKMNLARIDPTCFDQERWIDANRGKTNTTGDTAIRWRISEKQELETNAKFIRWSDGSLQLYIGKEVFDVKEQALPKESHGYIYNRNKIDQAKSALIAQGRLTCKLILHTTGGKQELPSSVNTQTEHVQDGKRIKIVTTKLDPEEERRLNEESERKRIMSQNRARTKERNAMHGYQHESHTSGFIENSDDDVSDDDNDRDKDRRFDDAEREQRLANAKRGGVVTTMSKRRRGMSPEQHGLASSEDEAQSTDDDKNDDDDDDDRRRKRKDKSSTSRPSSSSNKNAATSSATNNAAASSGSRQADSSKRKNVLDDSDDDDNDNNDSSRRAAEQATAKRRKVLDSDSE